MIPGKYRHRPASISTTILILLILLAACSGQGTETVSTGPVVETLPGGVLHYRYETLTRRYLEFDTLAVWDPWADTSGYQFTRVPYVQGLGSSLFTVDPRNCQVVEVDIYDLQGNLRRRLTVPTPDLRVTPAVHRWWRETGFEESIFSRIGRNASWEFTGKGLEDWPVAERRQAVIGVKEDPLENIWVLSSTDNLSSNCIDIYNNDMSYLGSYTNISLPESFLGDGTAVFRQDNDDQAIFYFITLADDIS